MTRLGVLGFLMFFFAIGALVGTVWFAVANEILQEAGPAGVWVFFCASVAVTGYYLVFLERPLGPHDV